MNGLGPLLADMEDLIFPLVVIVFIILGVLRQVFAKLQEPEQGPARRPDGPRRPEAPRPQGPLHDEIGEFLRNASKRRAPGRPAAGGAPAWRPKAGMRSPAGPQPYPGDAPVDIELVEAKEEVSVDEHIRQRLGTERLGHLAPVLDGEVTHTDDRVQDHVHSVFDHDLSRLSGTPGESARSMEVTEPESPEDRIGSVPPTAAAGLTAMLADPGNLRQAILLSEILNRPESRWT